MQVPVDNPILPLTLRTSLSGYTSCRMLTITARFDPAFQMIPPGSLRYPPPIFSPGEQFELDEHGNVNWHAAWLKELQHLQHLTEEQQKNGADQEWYRMMLFRVRGAMMAPPMNPGEPVVHVPGAPSHAMPPNPAEVPQEQQ